MSYIGNNEIGKVFLGDIEIDKAYLGDKLVFSSVPPRPKYTVTFYPSSYSGTSTSNPANGYTSETSTTYATTRVSNNANTLQSTYFIFNTSSIPQDATILSVSCKAKVKMTGTSGIATRKIGLYSGTTVKGTESTMTNTLNTFSFSGATWTRQEVGNARVRYYTSKPSSGNPPWVYFYGATLTVTYTV